jgi:hypothetical protein
MFSYLQPDITRISTDAKQSETLGLRDAAQPAGSSGLR